MAGHKAKPKECQMCYWPTDELTEVDCYARTPGHGPFTPDEEKEWGWLCHVCRGTYAGNAYKYPRGSSYEQHIIVLSTLSWQTNYLASLIKEKN